MRPVVMSKQSAAGCHSIAAAFFLQEFFTCCCCCCCCRHRQDRVKLEKARQKEEVAARAAFEAHQKQAAAAVKGHKPTIQRNK
jgi:hypothetical protein